MLVLCDIIGKYLKIADVVGKSVIYVGDLLLIRDYLLLLVLISIIIFKRIGVLIVIHIRTSDTRVRVLLKSVAELVNAVK